MARFCTQFASWVSLKFPCYSEEMTLEILDGAELAQDRDEYPNQSNSENSGVWTKD